jgi:hypothetical protein
VTVFASTFDLVLTGLGLAAGTFVLALPVLYLTAPVHTDRGRSRVGIELARDAYDRLIPRSRPTEPHPGVDA